LVGVINVPITAKLSVSVGARGAQQINQLQSFSQPNQNSINRALATTLGASYLLRPEAKVYLRRAESFRFPKADEDASAPLGANGLKTQRGAAYESGIEWDVPISLTKIGIYQLNLKDEI